MKIFICASKHHYHKIPEIAKELEKMGHELTMPNSFDEPFKEMEMQKLSEADHRAWKKEMILKDEENIDPQDAILVLNFEKNEIPNYIGGATFLEMATALRLGKKIFIYNPIPALSYADEIHGMDPIIINQDLTLIK